MKWLGWALVLALLAVGLAVLAQFNHGNVVLLLPPTRIDLSLNFFLLILGVLLIVVGVQLLTFGLMSEMIAASRQGARGRQVRVLQVERIVGGEPEHAPGVDAPRGD